jgi:hypothetical protein
MGFSLRRPRRRHILADKDEQEKFINQTLPNKVEEISKKYPNDKVEVWAEDEHRVGLQPIIRGVWVKTGSKRVTIPVNPGYEWFYMYAFVHPKSGSNYWWILPSCNKELFTLALTDFACEFGANKGKQLILVVDGAGWHTSQNIKVPEGVHIVALPPRSPELQPSERLWKYSDEPLANKGWKDIEKMKDTAWQRCDWLTRQTELISSLTDYHWWPQDVSPMN